MKLKVCGLNNPENIIDIANLKPDFIGFIFYPESKRFISDNLSNNILEQIPDLVKKVGVFVDAPIDEIIETYNKYQLDYIQLHGNEDHVYCAKLFLKRIPIIKAFQIDSDFDFKKLEAFLPFCSYFLFDTKAKFPGGNGIKFSWKILKKYNLRKPFFLSGGIAPDDINLINELNFDMLYAIDINSKFEIQPGVKNALVVNDLKIKLKTMILSNRNELKIG